MNQLNNQSESTILSQQTYLSANEFLQFYLSESDRILMDSSDDMLKPFELKKKQALIAACEYSNLKMLNNNGNSYVLLCNIFELISEQYNTYFDMILDKEFYLTYMDNKKYQVTINKLMVESEISIGKSKTKEYFDYELTSYTNNVVCLWNKCKTRKQDDIQLVIQSLINGTRKTITTINFNNIKNIQFDFDKLNKSVKITIKSTKGYDYQMTFSNIDFDTIQNGGSYGF